jgi:hypothetical protein
LTHYPRPSATPRQPSDQRPARPIAVQSRTIARQAHTVFLHHPSTNPACQSAPLDLARLSL